jgi:hypothetical protein
MGTSDVLQRSIRQTHDQLAERLAAARAMAVPREEPRGCHERIDVFLAITSKHLHAVDAVLLPPARKRCPDGSCLVRDYLRSAKHLEILLVHVKAHVYGSVYESGHAWQDVWSDLEAAMADHRRHEVVLGDRLTATLDAPMLELLTERLRNAELAAPSRPHPYTPHTGLLGLAARKVMHAADLFWDVMEGRMVPEPDRPPRKAPGPVTQYFLCDPHFDEKRQPHS